MYKVTNPTTGSAINITTFDDALDACDSVKYASYNRIGYVTYLMNDATLNEGDKVYNPNAGDCIWGYSKYALYYKNGSDLFIVEIENGEIVYLDTVKCN